MNMMNGKKIAFALLLLSAVLLCTACGESAATANSGVPTSTEIPAILNQAEYVLYQNIFYNDYGPQYDGKEVTKTGIFTSIYDAFNGVNRYYVWGYLDNTRCCDWQWEIKVEDAKNLPANGSVVSVRGTFASSQDALDGYWITNPTIDVQTIFVGEACELNMLTMSDTLERVQIMNILYRSEAFEGKQFSAYGRVLSADTLQDPYYDGSWQIPFSVPGELPAIGTTVSLRGKVVSGALEAASLTKLD